MSKDRFTDHGGIPIDVILPDAELRRPDVRRTEASNGCRRAEVPRTPFLAVTLSPAVYRALADTVVALHFGFVLFVVLGGLLVLRWRRAAWVHLPCAAWGALIEFGGWICPLTPVEKHFRALGNQAGYPESFVEHYITRLMYPAGLTRGMQVAIGVFVIAVNLALYWAAFRRRRSGAGRARP